jgi:hypothetical protein
VLRRAGLRIHGALALGKADLDELRGSGLVRHVKGGRRREVGNGQIGLGTLAAGPATHGIGRNGPFRLGVRRARPTEGRAPSSGTGSRERRTAGDLNVRIDLLRFAGRSRARRARDSTSPIVGSTAVHAMRAGAELGVAVPDVVAPVEPGGPETMRRPRESLLLRRRPSPRRQPRTLRARPARVQTAKRDRRSSPSR